MSRGRSLGARHAELNLEHAAGQIRAGAHGGGRELLLRRGGMASLATYRAGIER